MGWAQLSVSKLLGFHILEGRIWFEIKPPKGLKKHKDFRPWQAVLILNFHALYFRSLVQFFFVSWGDREFNLLPRKVILVCEAWWSLSLCILYLPWCRIFWTKYRESERSFFFFLFQGFMSLWCGNLVGVAISSSTSFCGPFMKRAKLNCYTFLNIAIFIIIAVDPKWRATWSLQNFL